MKGTCLKGRYLLGEVIGKGGMAVVYKAYDFRSGRTVAVKVLREQYNQDREFVAPASSRRPRPPPPSATRTSSTSTTSASRTARASSSWSTSTA